MCRDFKNFFLKIISIVLFSMFCFHFTPTYERLLYWNMIDAWPLSSAWHFRPISQIRLHDTVSSFSLLSSLKLLFLVLHMHTYGLLYFNTMQNFDNPVVAKENWNCKQNYQEFNMIYIHTYTYILSGFQLELSIFIIHRVVNTNHRGFRLKWFVSWIFVGNLLGRKDTRLL